MQITLELPAEKWEAAVLGVGRIRNAYGPLKSGHLLVAMIVESPSWRQKGDADAEYDAGWHMTTLETSVQSLTISSGQVSLAHQARNKRHSCALHTLEATGDIRQVTLWLGHASIRSTEMYLRTDPARKLETLAAGKPPVVRKGSFDGLQDELLPMLSGLAAPSNT
ncbi:MAG: hypothetical protein OXN89_01015 [Bryobacterales bacterium]|nr:hypothetical protein [Bryobacterales bacterium]